MVTENEFGLYYSGANSNEQIQEDPNKSLGGYRSFVLLNNDSFNNLFDELGMNELNEGCTNYRCIFIKNNNTTENINNLSLFITGKKDFEKIKFGISKPKDNISAVQFLNNQESKPYNVTFYEAYSEEDKIILIEELEPNDILALWLCREVNPGVTERKQIGSLDLVFNWE